MQARSTPSNEAKYWGRRSISGPRLCAPLREKVLAVTLPICRSSCPKGGEQSGELFLDRRSSSQLLCRPGGEPLPKNLHVVANVHGKGGMDEEIVDRGRQRILRPRRRISSSQAAPGMPAAGHSPRLRAPRSSPAAAGPAAPRPPARCGTRPHVGWKSLRTDRIHRPGRREHPMGHAAAKPKSLPRLVEITGVAHAMPDLSQRCRTRRSSPRRWPPRG